MLIGAALASTLFKEWADKINPTFTQFGAKYLAPWWANHCHSRFRRAAQADDSDRVRKSG
jgi:hypothetical protein